jgi:hypothetical protein
MNRLLFVSPVATIIVGALLLLTACGGAGGFTGVIRSDERPIRVDVDNRIFAKWQAVDHYGNGLNATKATITITTSTNVYEQVVVQGDMDPAYSFTPFDVPVNGVLASVKVELARGINGISAILEATSPQGDWLEWEVFENVGKFRIRAIAANDSATGGKVSIDAAPRGREALRLLVDSGLTPYYQRRTDLGDTLTAGQIALEPQFMEHPMDIKYMVYYAIVDKDLRQLHDRRLQFSATYLPDPWVDVWTFDEIITSGRSIAGAMYKLQALVPGVQFDAMDPLQNGHRAVLIDTTLLSNLDLSGKYLLATVLLTYQGLYIPGTMVCVEIR